MIATGLASAADTPTLTRLPEVMLPLPPLVAAARRAGIPTEGAAELRDDRKPVAGDAATVLVTLREPDGLKQWLIDLVVATPTQQEIAKNPEHTFDLNSTSGRVLHFPTGGCLAIDIRILGPVTAHSPGTVGDQHARAIISPALLAGDLDNSARAMGKASRLPKPAPGTTPAPLTEADERAIFGFFPALIGFTQAVQATPGLREILWDTVAKPSLWSIVKRAGRVDMKIDLGNDSTASVTSAPGFFGAGDLYRMSFLLSFNDTPGLACSLLVTTPRPPLLTTAGIVGLAAERPGDASRKLDLRLIATRRGGVIKN